MVNSLLKKHKNELLIAIGILCALFLVIVSGCEKKVEGVDISSTDDYTEFVEKKLCEVIKEIEGTGELKVMVSAECGKEYVYAQNDETGESTSKRSYFTDGEREAVLVKEIDPKIRGVAVVCDGGDDPLIRAKIISLVSSVLDISTNKIFVGS
ncbi:MAG: hypothetical protein IKU52_00300 [Clostridia bacterium]|nr:hypothetical protein [Clostridia bacterium]